MVKKRLIGVITVKDGWAVQSFGYRRHLPLGHPEVLAENLNRWGADEILIQCIDRTRTGRGPDFALLQRLNAMGLSTPLTYAGGVRDASDAGRVVQSGAERLCVDATLQDSPESVRRIAALIGAQAVIGAMPFDADDRGARWVDYRTGSPITMTAAQRALFEEGVISEVLVIDRVHEGSARSFAMPILDHLPVAEVPLIVFGGLSEAGQIESVLRRERVAAVGVGNFLNYREHAIQALKRELAGTTLRAASYARDY